MLQCDVSSRNARRARSTRCYNAGRRDYVSSVAIRMKRSEISVTVFRFESHADNQTSVRGQRASWSWRAADNRHLQVSHPDFGS
jgi:hypothetical protein